MVFCHHIGGKKEGEREKRGGERREREERERGERRGEERRGGRDIQCSLESYTQCTK